jgi:hypothetical protein
LLSDKRTHAKLARPMTPSDDPKRPRTTAVPARVPLRNARERVGAQIEPPAFDDRSAALPAMRASLSLCARHATA